MRPGNAGGGKDPDFWCAFEDGEVAVIGESLQTPLSDGNHRRMLCREAKARHVPSKSRARPVLPVCLTMKPVGEPDAGNPHVRFDERGWETERCRMAQATAPIPDSTEAALSLRGVMSAAGES
jgi:hypothetical protein